MALDVSGIGNVGDFFSQHYLDALLENDLKDTLKRWSTREKEDKVASPPKKLARLADSYFRLAAKAQGLSDPAGRLDLSQSFHADLMDALGYERAPAVELLDDDRVVPVLSAYRQNNQPYLWVVEAPFPESDDEADPLNESPLRNQALSSGEDGPELADESWRDLLDGPILRADHPPRWLLLLAGSDVFLVDRDKWHQGKYLHFQLGRLLGLRDPKALRAACGLLHREVLIPEGGQSLLERLDEQSHKHAFAVSTDLKYGAQKAIEILGNEAVRYRLSVSKLKTFDEGLEVGELTRECITYLYRLLFLFYVEARGADLGVVPMQSDAYRLGYSLESLRDLELVPLTTDEARNGTYINDSLRRLFRLIQRGHGLGQRAMQQGEDPALHETFLLRGLRSPLFDEDRTPILRSVKFSNRALQEVLQLLSLSREGKSKTRGRISYAQLGINQLGAVYEGLLSYTGFFAQEDLFEIRAEKELHDEDARTYFVPASKIEGYRDTEKVKDEHERPVVHKKGAFLFRLSGRERERSASYYTPEVLTQCLTKYTLKVRLGEPLLPEDDTEESRKQRLSADEILKLTICEPAMGSGAFLNEAVNQLAHKYLEKKQAELGETIPAEDYQREWAKVKYHFVVHNCYGVDLNPLAAELGKVSLWLNVLQPDVEAPYLDQRLVVGNSLIGARREVFAGHLLTARGKGNDSWLDAVPEKVPLREEGVEPGEDLRWPERPKGSVYHFLVPDAGMVAYADDKVVKELRPEESEALRAWRSEITKPYTEAEVERVVALSDRIDGLWKGWAQERIARARLLRQSIQLWGQKQHEQLKAGARKADQSARFLSVEECEELVADRDKKVPAGERLKLVMDYWAALWFWPVLEAGMAPSRREWLEEVEAVLEGGGGGDAVCALGDAAGTRLKTVRRTADEHRFLHWQLTFAETFAQRGGIDGFLGNPPWIRIEWKESGILGDMEPLLNLRKWGAKRAADRRRHVLGESQILSKQYLLELANSEGESAFVGSATNYAQLQGVKGNSYKCFIEKTRDLASPSGATGLIHPEGPYDDVGGGRARKSIYPRLRLHAQFVNERDLFPEIHNLVRFSLNVYGPDRAPDFLTISSLFVPETLDSSLVHDGGGTIPGVKTEDGAWDMRPHRSRVVRVREDILSLFAKLYDSANTPPSEARLPVLHSSELLDVLQRFLASSRPLVSYADKYHLVSEHFNESRQQADGTIRRQTHLCASAKEWIVSGPHFYVATPFNKTPNEDCRHNKDYSEIDLTIIPNDYLPRTNYLPACPSDEYRRRTPHWNETPVTAYYRHIHRRMIAPTGERTLVPALIPPGSAHVHTVVSFAFSDGSLFAAVHGAAASVPYDFFVKSTGRSDLYGEAFAALPVPSSVHAQRTASRALRLNCLTTHYADLWQEVVTPEIAKDAFAKHDPRLPSWSHLTPKWTRDSALRTPYERRQALVELDALAALSLGLTVEQLLLIYRVQFPVLQQYERETYYDQHGKIVFTVNRGLSGVGVSRKQWEEVEHAQAGDELPDWAHDQQGPFVPPFDACDREVDMAQAYHHFQEKLGIVVEGA